MSEQGDKAAADDWWNRLYDGSTPDTGPAATAGDTVDDRFDSAADAVGVGAGETPKDRTGSGGDSGTGENRDPAPDPARGPGGSAQRPRAWWEQSPPSAGPPPPAPPESVPPPRRAPWEPPASFTPSDARPLPFGTDEADRADETDVPDERDVRGESEVADERAVTDKTDEGAEGAVTDVADRIRPDVRQEVWPFASPASTAPPAPGPVRSGLPAPQDPPAPLAPPPARRPGSGADAPSEAEPAPGAEAGTTADPVPPPEPRRKEQAEATADAPAPASASPGPPGPAPRTLVTHLGDRPPTYDPEPTALPAAHPERLDEIVPDTALDGAGYGTFTLRAVSVRGDSARYRGEPRRDALLVARFGSGADALVLVAVATGARAAEGAHRAAAEVCRWIGAAVGRSHSRLSEDIRAGRRGDLKSGLQRLTDRGFGKLRARAAELGVEPEEYTASLRCLLLPADPACRTRVFFGVGAGGLLRLRDGGWQDLEPLVPEPAAIRGEPVVGFGSLPAETPEGDRLTMDLEIAKPPAPYIEGPLPPPAEPFRFRASVARTGDTLLLCSSGFAEPLRGEPALAQELAGRWGPVDPPGLAEFLADTGLRMKGYADDRTAVGVWEA